MRWIWISALIVLAGLAAAALPLMQQPAGGVTGGGASAASASLRLSGAVGGWSTGLSQNGALRLEGGFFPAVGGPPPNAADRQWLRIEREGKK